MCKYLGFWLAAVHGAMQIHVTGETHAGGRRHMEDYIAVQLHCDQKFCKSHDHAFMAVFDGHGGKEAAKFARERLWGVIQRQPNYFSNEIETIRESIQEAFVALHHEMEPLRGMCGCRCV